MTVAVALAMLERQGRWLLQLRDDIEGIVHPGTWALFGGHLEAGESPEIALRRELLEEIHWQAKGLNFWFEHHDPPAHCLFLSLPARRALVGTHLAGGPGHGAGGAEGNPQRQGLEP